MVLTNPTWGNSLEPLTKYKVQIKSSTTHGDGGTMETAFQTGRLICSVLTCYIVIVSECNMIMLNIYVMFKLYLKLTISLQDTPPLLSAKLKFRLVRVMSSYGWQNQVLAETQK